ncbi:MAG: acyl-[acyl-carrier-protein] thioesterase [Coprobacillaceae bacterium]
MKNEETIIKKKITYQESDFTGQYRLANLFSTLSDLATLNALQVNIWKEELQLQYGWILTKQTMKLNRPIEINEEIKFSTRAGKSSRIQFTRLYDFYDSENKSIGGVYSTWTFIDIHKRRIVRPDKVGIVIPEVEEHQHAVDGYQEIESDIPMLCKAKREVVYSDIDVNQHMNNYRYIEWSMDVIDYKIFETHYISEVSMAFKKEMAPGTKAKVLYGEKDNYFKVRIVSENEEIVYFEIGGYFKEMRK